MPLNQLETSNTPTTREEQYYFPDGNVVLQVGGGLFKIHSSLLTQESETFKDMFTLPTIQYSSEEHPEIKEADKEGSCDENPILIPGVARVAFRNFLLMFYGRPTNPNYLSTMMDTTKTDDNHDLSQFHRYLDIADISHRFAASTLESWALKQLKGLSSSTIVLAQTKPVIDYQLRALVYARIIDDKKLEHQVRNFVELSYSYALPGTFNPLTPSASLGRRQKMLSLFKYPNIQTDHTSLFGYIFCATLGLGNQFWLKQALLSREDRIKLLSAHVQLTPLPVSKLGLAWINDTISAAHPQGNSSELRSCDQCNFQPAWEEVFSTEYSLHLKERQDPLGGVVLLSSLVVKRLEFAQAIAEVGEECEEGCRERFVEFVDEKVDHVFTLFASFYKDVE